MLGATPHVLTTLRRHDVYGLIQWDDPHVTKKPLEHILSLQRACDNYLSHSFRYTELGRLYRVGVEASGAQRQSLSPLQERCSEMILELMKLDRETRSFLCLDTTNLSMIQTYRRMFGEEMMFTKIWTRLPLARSLSDVVGDLLILIDQGLAFHDPNTRPHAVAVRMEHGLLTKLLSKEEAIECLGPYRAVSSSGWGRRLGMVQRAEQELRPMGTQTLGQLVEELSGVRMPKRPRLLGTPQSLPENNFSGRVFLEVPAPTLHAVSGHLSMCQHWMEENLWREGDAQGCYTGGCPPSPGRCSTLSYQALQAAILTGNVQQIGPVRSDYLESLNAFVSGVVMTPTLRSVVESKKDSFIMPDEHKS